MAVTTAMSASKRRLVYGLNVAVTVVLAVALVALVVWAAAAFGGRADLTRSDVNSLAGRTVQLLRGLDQDITITGLYTTALKEVHQYRHRPKHQKRLSDLLDLYETAARGKVTTHMIDPSKSPAKVTALLKRLAEKPAYEDEAAPHVEVLQAFPALSARLVELLHSELNELQRLVSADPPVARLNPLGIIERNFRITLQEAEDSEADVQALKAEEIPRYGRAAQVVKDFFEQTRRVLEDAQTWMTTNGVKVPGITQETKDFFAGGTQRYKETLKEVTALLKQAQDLERVQLEELHEKLKRGQSVLVETENEAVVLSQEEVWPWRTDRNVPEPPDGDPRDFAGEQAISSAILQMTQKEKTAVIFTRFGGEPLLRPSMPPARPMMRMPQAPYRGLNELLQKENFVTEEWDVQTQAEPPKVEDAARIVYVVFPPAPPERPNPMQPPTTPGISNEQKQRIFDAVEKSGMAIFLARWMVPSMPFAPIAGKYEFADYLKSNWGIQVKDEYLTLEFVPDPRREDAWFIPGRAPMVTSEVVEYTDHPIASPLRGLRSGFLFTVPLELVTDETKPAGTTVEPIVQAIDSQDVWGVKDVSRLQDDLNKPQGTRRYDDDMTPPFPLAMAATDARAELQKRLEELPIPDEWQGKVDQTPIAAVMDFLREHEVPFGSIVVFGSDQFAADAVMNMKQLVMVGGALRLARLYPANADLFINALHWLTGEADRIAVGPQPGDVPRLEKLKDDATLTFTRVFLVGIWPGVALLIGAGVWLLRRR